MLPDTYNIIFYFWCGVVDMSRLSACNPIKIFNRASSECRIAWQLVLHKPKSTRDQGHLSAYPANKFVATS